MREIKFRAWNKKLRIMVYENEDNTADYWDGVDISLVEMVNTQLQDDGYEWLQFTGLRDKNGKEIYEGDVAEFVNAKNSDDYSRGEIFFNNGCFWFDRLDADPLYSLKVNKMEVIGNIYENPELLGEAHA